MTFGGAVWWGFNNPSAPSIPDSFNPAPMETRGKNFGNHHPTIPIVKPGRDCDGNCNPCPPGIAPFEEAGNEHGSTTGTHWHKIEYNQDINSPECTCFPVSRDSPDGVNWK